MDLEVDKGDRLALAEVCALLSAIPDCNVFVVTLMKATICWPNNEVAPYTVLLEFCPLCTKSHGTLFCQIDHITLP